MVEEYEPSQIRQVHWAKDLQPHLAFMPRNFQFTHPLFRRFEFTHLGLPIVHDGGWYYLERTLAESWTSMEGGLVYVGCALLSVFLLPLGSGTRYPYHFGFNKKHQSERAARNCAWNSLQAFLELIAYCRHAISLQRSDWIERLSKINNGRSFHPGWLQELNSAISLYEPYGAIVDPSHCGWSNHLDRLDGQCPLWFLGATIDVTGKLEFTPTAKLPERWVCPSPQEIQDFLQDMSAVDAWVRAQPPEDFDLCSRPYCYPCLGSPQVLSPLHFRSGSCCRLLLRDEEANTDQISLLTTCPWKTYSFPSLLCLLVPVPVRFIHFLCIFRLLISTSWCP